MPVRRQAVRRPGNHAPLVSCLCATYGRFGKLQRSLACFLSQDYPARELIILNSHLEPLELGDWATDHHFPVHVRVINHPDRTAKLGDLRNILLDEQVRGEFLVAWDDDDLWLPWYLSQAVEQIGDRAAWRPFYSWWTPDNGRTFQLAHNSHEPSILWRTEAVRAAGGYSDGEGDEHLPLLNKIPIAETDVGWWASWVYWWGDGMHVSAGLGGSRPAEERAVEWRKAQRDIRPGELLAPDFEAVAEVWRNLSGFITHDERQAWRQRVEGCHAPA